MVWSLAQRLRLGIEKEKLEKYFRLGVTWIDPEHETKVEVMLRSNADNEYELRVYIPADFPNSCPILVVVLPPKLLQKNGSRLPQRSSPFHTLADKDGFHRICHFYPPEWTQDITLYQVFMKGRLWIEGYEGHLQTGKNIDAFLSEQKTGLNADHIQQQGFRAQGRSSIAQPPRMVNRFQPRRQAHSAYDWSEDLDSPLTRLAFSERRRLNLLNNRDDPTSVFVQCGSAGVDGQPREEHIAPSSARSIPLRRPISSPVTLSRQPAQPTPATLTNPPLPSTARFGASNGISTVQQEPTLNLRSNSEPRRKKKSKKTRKNQQA